MKTVLLVTLDSDFQAKILQGSLANEEIESFTKNEFLSSVLTNIPGFQIEVHVLEEDYERAMELVKEGFPELL